MVKLLVNMVRNRKVAFAEAAGVAGVAVGAAHAGGRGAVYAVLGVAALVKAFEWDVAGIDEEAVPE